MAVKYLTKVTQIPHEILNACDFETTINGRQCHLTIQVIGIQHNRNTVTVRVRYLYRFGLHHYVIEDGVECITDLPEAKRKAREIVHFYNQANLFVAHATALEDLLNQHLQEG